MASEKLRQREVHSWLASKLDVKRAIVTLISTDHQYILAEATKTLSLVTGDGNSEAQDEVWFGSASLPRSQGISGDALTPANYTAVDANGKNFVAPALVVNGMTIHESYRFRPYAGQGVTFYCGVPIITSSGIAIGVYTVTDDRPRRGLQPEELRFMHDMAATVMRHLEVISNEGARFRGETMVFGLGKFISGASSLNEESGPTLLTPSRISDKSELAATQPVRLFKGMTVTAANSSKSRAGASDIEASSSQNTDQSVIKGTNPERSIGQNLDNYGPPVLATGSQPTHELNNPHTESPLQKRQQIDSTGTATSMTSDVIFSRAATILQECMAADGVFFFDATAINFAKRAHLRGSTPASRSERTEHFRKNPSECSTSNTQTTKMLFNAEPCVAARSDDSDAESQTTTDQRMCKLIGYALDTADKFSTTDVLHDIRMSERGLSRMVTMYPLGKIFSLHMDDSVSVDDEAQMIGESKLTDSHRSKKGPTANRAQQIPPAITKELKHIVPCAQSIIWLPLWDFSKHRWSAGLILWSNRSDRPIAAQEDLIYLKAFANSIMVEVARLDSARADNAKSTFIANISHELRTPLHGILGNLDILQDTKLTNFQQSLVAAIEVCGRTLSDTIDHVLDYSKINQLSQHSKKRSIASSTPSLPHDAGGTSMIEEDFDIALIIEEAVEATYASYTFQSNGRKRLHTSSQSGEQLSVPPSTSRKEMNVHVTVDLEYRDNWYVYSQPSAIRRIVTNLFGNALKYTHSGTIQISLSSPKLAKRNSLDSLIPILLVVKDTGRGMSKDFVQNHAFVPFSQESQFSLGTGLGLSIVQQIVKALGGKIELQSDQGVGTEIRVRLNLSAARSEDVIHKDASYQRLLLILRADPHVSIGLTTADDAGLSHVCCGLRTVISSIQSIARNWLGLFVDEMPVSRERMPNVTMYLTPPTTQQLDTAFHFPERRSKARVIVLALNAIDKANLTQAYAELSNSAATHTSSLAEFKADAAREETENGDVPKDHRSRSSNGETDNDSIDSKSIVDNGLQLGSLVASAFTDSILATVNNVDQSPLPSNSHHSTTQDRRSENGSSRPSVPENLEVLQVVDGPNTHQPPSNVPRSISASSSFVSIKELPAQLPSMRVLLVDDNDINLNILRTCLKRACVPHDFARDGLQARNLFRRAFHANSGFTHVLMDISMPVMDGIQSTREIRDFERQQDGMQMLPLKGRQAHLGKPTEAANKNNSEVKKRMSGTSRSLIIALSGVASEATQMEMLEAGADMFLTKPVKLRNLLNVLER